MKQQLRLSILVLVTGAFLFSCKVKKKEDAVTEEKTVPFTSQEFIGESVAYQEIRIEYVGQNSPNLYSAVVSWPVTKTLSTFRIINSKNENKETAANFIKLENLHGGIESKILFEQYSVQDQKRLASFDVIISPPQDLVFDNVVSLTENVDKTVERLFLTSAAKIYTNQFNLNIKAKKIYSEFGAVITNFPTESVAPFDTVGMSGGKIEIQTETADGQLQVVLNSQRGGQGRFGSPAVVDGDIMAVVSVRPVCPGNDGRAAGTTGSFFYQSIEKNDFAVSARIMITAGGDPGEINFKCHRRNPYVDFYNTYCKPEDPVRANCNSTAEPKIGPLSLAGQICVKMNSAENFKCN